MCVFAGETNELRLRVRCKLALSVLDRRVPPDLSRDELKKQQRCALPPLGCSAGSFLLQTLYASQLLPTLRHPVFPLGLLTHSCTQTKQTKKPTAYMPSLLFVATTKTVFFPPRVLRFLLLHFFPHTVFLSLPTCLSFNPRSVETRP